MVAAVGIPTVRGDWLKAGSVVIDAGYNPGNIGDVATEEAVGIASMITPVPSGVGPDDDRDAPGTTVAAATSGFPST